MSTRDGVHAIMGAITPAYQTIDANELEYPNLRQALGRYRLPDFLKQGSVLFRRGYFESAELREDLQIAYFLTAAYRLQKAWTPPSKLFWSSQLTLTSVRLFGKPLSGEVAKLALDELRFFEDVAESFPRHRDFFEPVIAAYGSLVTKRQETSPRLEIKYRQLLDEVRAVLYRRYGEVFACFDTIPSGSQLDPYQIGELFGTACRVLASADPKWHGWTVTYDNSAKLCVSPLKRAIIIGRKRAPVSVEEVRGLFAHEVLVHVRRSIEGLDRSPGLALGLPGYMAAEEGIGVLVESAVNGRFSPKIKDRYVDIALALGSGRRRPLTRNELFTFCYSRAVIRAVVKAEDISLDKLEKVTWEHVNRIYRGSLGNHYVGVFTRDVAYYKGFIKIARYLERKRQTMSVERALDYLMQGKFDPTNQDHRAYLRSHSKQNR